MGVMKGKAFYDNSITVPPAEGRKDRVFTQEIAEAKYASMISQSQIDHGLDVFKVNAKTESGTSKK